MSSVGTAVQQACEALTGKLLAIARQTYPVFKDAETVRFEDGQLHTGDVSVSLAQLVKDSGEEALEVQVDSEPDKSVKAMRALPTRRCLSKFR